MSQEKPDNPDVFVVYVLGSQGHIVSRRSRNNGDDKAFVEHACRAMESQTGHGYIVVVSGVEQPWTRRSPVPHPDHVTVWSVSRSQLSETWNAGDVQHIMAVAGVGEMAIAINPIESLQAWGKTDTPWELVSILEKTIQAIDRERGQAVPESAAALLVPARASP
ncbi:MAG: hypothetical protein M3O22_04265 [Pseudomonadota bacterium]|nr:hypothetical protein [Pseudomonadota bacterium]